MSRPRPPRPVPDGGPTADRPAADNVIDRCSPQGHPVRTAGVNARVRHDDDYADQTPVAPPPTAGCRGSPTPPSAPAAAHARTRPTSTRARDSDDGATADPCRQQAGGLPIDRPGPSSAAADAGPAGFPARAGDVRQ